MNMILSQNFSSEFIPKISVIIPMYNVEKYITQCLGSLLSQTFQDFEVIVVDDCSTDNSIKIVENLSTKFNGRLKLIKQQENSGTPSIPRSIGIKKSHGKYVFFLDSDDMIVNNALEILYNAAENTNAEVVHAEKYFVPVGTGDIINQNTKFRIGTHQSPPFVDEVTIEIDDIGNRIKRFCQKNFFWWVSNKLFLKSFLIENKIDFVNIPVSEDIIFVFNCLYYAKKYVRIPNIIYIHRFNLNSATSSSISLEKRMHRNIVTMFKGLKELDKLFDNMEFFIKNPDYKYMIVNFFIQQNTIGESDIYLKYPINVIDTLFNKEFELQMQKDDKILINYFFHLINIYTLQLKSSNKL